MLFEDILILIALGMGVIFVGLPGYKLYRRLTYKRDPLQEAKERHEQARIALEAAKLDNEAAKIGKETNKVFDELYSETLSEVDNEAENKQKGGTHGY